MVCEKEQHSTPAFPMPALEPDRAYGGADVQPRV